MENIQPVQYPQSKINISISLILLLGLFFLRIPFATGIILFSKIHPLWLTPIFDNCTFALTAILIWWERKRLKEFNIGYGALGIFILGPIVFSATSKVLSVSLSNPLFNINIPWLQIAIAILLLIALIVKRPNLKKVNLKSAIWIIISIIIGLVTGALHGYITSVVLPTPRGQEPIIPIFIFLSLRQITFAANLEEPLFRGFLWGYLKNVRWKDIWICFFQSSLFFIAHAYYFYNPFIFISTFIVAFILGLVAWKSNSIANTMTIHGLFNATSDIVQHTIF